MSKSTKLVKVVNPSPALMLVNGKGGQAMKNNKMILMPRQTNAAHHPKKRRKNPFHRRNNPTNVSAMLEMAAFSAVGALLAEFLVGFLPVQGLMKAVAKIVFGVGLAYGAEHISFIKRGATPMGVGAVATGVGDVVRHFMRPQIKSAMPVELAPGAVANGVIPDGAVPAAQVVKAAQAGNQAAIAALNDLPEDCNMGDVVWMPVSNADYGNSGLSDVFFIPKSQADYGNFLHQNRF
jgi:hypothetical protein